MHTIEKTFYEYLSEYAAVDGEKRLLFNENKSYTVSQVLALTDSLAGQMAKYGVQAGTYVALESFRTIETVLLLFALQTLGAVAILTDPRYSARTFLKNTDADVKPDYVLLYDGKVWQIIKGDVAAEMNFDEIYRYEYRRTTDSRLPSFIIFTSGSTGGTKAVVLSQFAILNNSEDTRKRGWYVPEDISIALLPVFHVFGLSLVITAVVTRHSVFFPEKTDVPYILQAMEKYGVTRLNGVPSLYLAMADTHASSGQNLSSLRTGLIGGGPCTARQFEYIENELGIRLVPVYGMSECIGISCGDYRDSQTERSGSVGRQYSMNKVYIANNEGAEVPVWEEGEICVESPFLMIGYLGCETELGAFKTGDLGYFDGDGFLHISGRKKDIIIRNGNNISACDIQRALLALDCVRDVAVVGMPDERCGEVPCAMVVLKAGMNMSEGDMRALAAQRLNKSELPKIIAFSNAIPLTATGKHDKLRLKEFFALWKEV